jgi:hypothetical protein
VASPAAFSWKWFGVFVGATTVLLALQLLPAFHSHFLKMWEQQDFDENGHLVVHLVASGGLFTLIEPVLLWVIPAVIIGSLSRRPLRRELVLGSLIGIFVQWVVWMIRVDGHAHLVITSSITLETSSGWMVLPPFFGLLIVNTLALLACKASVATTRSIAARVRREPRSEDQRKTTRWDRVIMSVLGTAVLFVVFVRFVGPSLHFYWQCDFHNPSAACRAGIDSYQSNPTDFYFWRDARGEATPGVILNSVKYVLLTGALFLIGPLVIALTTRRGRGVTAAWAAFLAWPAAVLASMIFLGFGQFDSVILLSLRLHLLAGFPWLAVGLIGAWAGTKLGPSLDLAEELGIDLDPPQVRDYKNW